jgi:hypothetical protein
METPKFYTDEYGYDVVEVRNRNGRPLRLPSCWWKDIQNRMLDSI